jgi:hypothetical protein
MRAAIYARVSTLDQEPENQLRELRRYTEARGWQATEFVDKGVSGARESRPALDELVKAAKRRKFDNLVVWRLDPPRAQPSTPDHATRRTHGPRSWLCEPWRGHRHQNAGRASPAPHPGGDCGVRAGEDCGTGAPRCGESEGARQAPGASQATRDGRRDLRPSPSPAAQGSGAPRCLQVLPSGLAVIATRWVWAEGLTWARPTDHQRESRSRLPVACRHTGQLGSRCRYPRSRWVLYRA